jgi:hypothetical protein
MARASQPPWRPTQFESLVDGPFDTSMGTARVKTNATFAYLKAMGNRQGPHALASEWVGTSLAKLFGLSVPEFAILTLEEVDCYPLPRNARTEPGPAFVSRSVSGHTWDRSTEELRQLENLTDITRLVVFDNWVRNCDRHPTDLALRLPNWANVYIAETEHPERFHLFAIDHTHCFDCGRDLTRRLSEIGNVRDEGVYGLFPEFREFIDEGELVWCSGMLQSVTAEQVRAIVDAIPREWEVSADARAALVELIMRRAAYLADRIDNGWGRDWRVRPEE